MAGTTLPASGRHLDAVLASADEHVCWAGVARDAAFLAESHWRPDLDACHPVRLGAATIHETAGVRPEVGGPVQVGVLDPDGPRLVVSTAASAFLAGS